MAETKIEISEAARLIAESNKQLAESLKPQHPLARAGYSQKQIDAVDLPPAPKRWRVVPCLSPDTGATFDAHVIESKEHPNGRITALANYRHPAGVYAYQTNGGRVPDQMQIFLNGSMSHREGEEPRADQLTQQFKQWRWTEFWQTDLRRYNGKGLGAHLCADSSGLKTPWQEGRVGALRED